MMLPVKFTLIYHYMLERNSNNKTSAGKPTMLWAVDLPKNISRAICITQPCGDTGI